MNSEKRSKAKLAALAASTTLHIAGIYYLGTIALDLALPEGTVDSMEMSYDVNEGAQTENTEVSVVDSPEQAPVAPPAPVVKKVAPTTPKAPPPPSLLPTKEQTSESPVTEEQSPVVVPVVEPAISKEDVPEDLIKDTYENDKTKEVPANDPLANNAPSTEPKVEAPPAALPSPIQTPAQTAKPYGKPEGIQSDKVLTPLSGNRGISYPSMARLRRLEGTTVVHYTVSPQGTVTDTVIAQSSGSSVLDNSAIETIKTWKFKPTGEAGVYERPIRFKLTGEEQEAPGQLRRTN